MAQLTHKLWMSHALEQARLARDNGDVPVGAVVVKDGKIIARGFNQVTSTHDPTCHAEVDAIRKACKELGTFQLDGCDLYTSFEPCPMCLGAIYWARPRRVPAERPKKLPDWQKKLAWWMVISGGVHAVALYDERVPAFALQAIKAVVVVFVILLYSDQVKGFVRRITATKGEI